MNAPYENSSSTSLVSRVMSPNSLALIRGQSGGANRQMIAQGVNQPLIAGIQLPCMGCAQYMTDTPVCVQCGRWGHVQCLGIQHVMGYPFCGDCFPDAQRETGYASSQQHEIIEWQRLRTENMISVQNIARQSSQAMALTGEALGGGLAMLAQGAATLTTGLVRGARNAIADSSLPSPPQPIGARPTPPPVGSSTTVGLKCEMSESKNGSSQDRRSHRNPG